VSDSGETAIQTPQRRRHYLFVSIYATMALVLGLVTLTNPNLTHSFGDDIEPCETSADQTFAGNGSPDSPYVIETPEDLNCMRQLVNSDAEASPGETYRVGKEWKLTNDLDLNGWGENGVWVPIGLEKSAPFQGHFYGAKSDSDPIVALSGYNISGLTSDYQGLFGAVGDSSVISDLFLQGSVVGTKYAGALAGSADKSNISNVINAGNITAQTVAGIIGIANQTIFKNVYNSGSIVSANGAQSQCGIVCLNNNGQITNALNFGQVSGAGNAGGIIGQASSAGIQTSYNAGQISGNIIGGIASSNDAFSSLSNLLNVGDLLNGAQTSGLAPEIQNGYRWQGVTTSPTEYRPLAGRDGVNAVDGQPVNCAQLTDANWWAVNLGFSGVEWNFDNLAQGYLPVPRSLTSVLSSRNLLKPFSCMTIVSVGPTAAAGQADTGEVSAISLPYPAQSANVWRYPANLNSLSFKATPNPGYILTSWTLSQEWPKVKNTVFPVPPAEEVFTLPDAKKGASIIFDQYLTGTFDQLFAVVFNSNGGNPVETQTVLNGKSATRPAQPTKSHSTFIDWYADPIFGGIPFDFNSPIISSLTLYAKWEIIPVPPTPAADAVKFVFSEKTASLVWSFPEASGFTGSYAIRNELSGFSAQGAVTGASGAVLLGERFAGTYTGEFFGTLTFKDQEVSYSVNFVSEVSLSAKEPIKQTTFADVNLEPEVIKYSGSTKSVRVQAISEERLESINWLAAYGITVGYGTVAGTNSRAYRPQNPVTRGAMAQFFQKLAGYSDAQVAAAYKGHPSKFFDIGFLLTGDQGNQKGKVVKVSQTSTTNSVINPARYYAILWLVDHKIASGCNRAQTKYCPTKSVTRGEIAEFLPKLVGIDIPPADSSIFPDVSLTDVTLRYNGATKSTKVSALTPEIVGSINWMAQIGITFGSGSTAGKTTYRPQDILNRGAMAQFMHRLAYKVGSTSVVPH
jgi:hypothetical protein